MSYLLSSIVFFILYFILSWITVYFFKPKVPRNYFLLYIILLSIAYSLLNFSHDLMDDDWKAAAFMCGLISFIVAGFTHWNSFYSILWGFTGGIVADLYEKPNLRKTEFIVYEYVGGELDKSKDMDRMLKRRVPGLIEGNYLNVLEDKSFKLQPKGIFLAKVTSILYKTFSLGKGGGLANASDGVNK